MRQNEALRLLSTTCPETTLEQNRVMNARQEEHVLQTHNAYTSVPISECEASTGNQSIATRWIDVNKRDEDAPGYKSMCVAKEIHKGPGDELIAGTPPAKQRMCNSRWR